MLIKIKYPGDWREGLAMNSMCWACRGPGFSSQNPHADSHLPVTPVLVDLMTSFYLSRLLYAHSTHKLTEAITSTNRQIDKYFLESQINQVHVPSK